MLAKKFRVPAQYFFQLRGRAVKSDLFLVKQSVNGLKYNRFAVRVSSKISRKAVVRNRIKRAVFNIIRGNPNFVKRTGLDILITAQPNVTTASKEKIIRDLLDALKKI